MRSAAGITLFFAALSLAACSVCRAGIEANEKEKTTFSIFAAGDVFPGAYLKEYIKNHGARYPFSRLKDTIETYDIAFANLESAISKKGSPLWAKKFMFRISPDAADCLKYSGLDVMSVANNHTMDFGEEAFIDTIEALETMDMTYVGGGRDGDRAFMPATFSLGTTTIHFLAYSDWVSKPKKADEGKAGINPLEIDRVVEDIKKYKKPGTVVIVSAHWGLQHVEIPKFQQVRKAHKMINAGADAVIGHHSHCPQSVEVYKGRPIFYSLGNFVFGMHNPDMVHNIAAAIAFDGDRLTSAEILPVHGKNFANQFSPYFLTGKGAMKVIKKIRKISSKFGTKITFSDDRGILDI